MFHISSQKEIFCSIIKPKMVSYLYRRSILHPLPDERVWGGGGGGGGGQQYIPSPKQTKNLNT